MEMGAVSRVNSYDSCRKNKGARRKLDGGRILPVLRAERERERKRERERERERRGGGRRERELLLNVDSRLQGGTGESKAITDKRQPVSSLSVWTLWRRTVGGAGREGVGGGYSHEG